MMVDVLPFAKGHGTGNDFVIVPDVDGRLRLSPARVASLCDRRRGIGGDGLLRVVRTAAEPEAAHRAAEAERYSVPTGPAQPPERYSVPTAPAQPPERYSVPTAPAQPPEWFMDYRNADGSLAEMCGNGARVFARYLVSTGLAAGPRLSILTRAGVVTAKVGPRTIAVTMPAVSVGGPGMARLSGVDYKGTEATCGNPNLVCVVDDPSALDLTSPPELDPAQFPDSANVEFIAPVAPGHVRMRVVERGVGETLSCGSGACAVAGVGLAGDDDALGRLRPHDGASSGRQAPAGTVVVDVPGGRLRVRIAGGTCVLSGPAVIVASGTISA